MLPGWKAQLSTELQAMTATLQERALELHAYLINEFGLVVTLAIYLSCATLTILALWRMIKLSFDIIAVWLFRQQPCRLLAPGSRRSRSCISFP